MQEGRSRRRFVRPKEAVCASDCAFKLTETRNSGDGDVDRWRRIRDKIHRQVCRRGYNTKKKAFTQYYGSNEMDASILMMPLVGFLPATDERVQSTIEAVERDLTQQKTRATACQGPRERSCRVPSGL